MHLCAHSASTCSPALCAPVAHPLAARMTTPFERGHYELCLPDYNIVIRLAAPTVGIRIAVLRDRDAVAHQPGGGVAMPPGSDGTVPPGSAGAVPPGGAGAVSPGQMFGPPLTPAVVRPPAATPAARPSAATPAARPATIDAQGSAGTGRPARSRSPRRDYPQVAAEVASAPYRRAPQPRPAAPAAPVAAEDDPAGRGPPPADDSDAASRSR